MRISVIVPTFNRRAIAKRTVESLAAQTFPVDAYELIVVVDGSMDGTAEAIGALRPACRLRVIEQSNQGLAAARNTGLRAARGDLVLFVDDDMNCSPELVATHVGAHEASQNIVAFGAILLSEDSPPGLAAECFKRELGAFYLQPRQSGEMPWGEIECVFSNSSLSRAALLQVGGFDDSFRMREDLELGVRLCRAGMAACYLSTAVAFQYYEKDSAQLIRDAEAFAVSDVLFTQKHAGGPIKGQWERYAQKASWKRALQREVARRPAAADALLAAVCMLGERYFSIPVLRNAGVRALQIRRRIHWHRKILELGEPS